MYSRDNVSDNASVATRKRVLLKRKVLPKLVGRGFLCVKVYSLACGYQFSEKDSGWQSTKIGLSENLKLVW